MEKIDIHLHLGVEDFIRNPAGGRGEKVTYVSGTTPHPVQAKMSGALEMLPHLKELGISQGILLSSGESGETGTSNPQVRQAAALAPDVYRWMCNVDPKEPDTLPVRLAQYKEQGAVGIGEFMINEWIDSPFIESVFSAAEALNLPILFHMSPEAGFNYGIADHPGLPLLEAALSRHPELIFIGHSQPFWHEISRDAQPDSKSRNSWGEGPVTPGGRLIQLFDRFPNLYGDLSANSGGNAIMRDEEFGLKFLETYQDRLMFGTDMTNTDSYFPLGGWLDKQFGQGNLSSSVYQKICRENAKRIFGL